MYQLRTASPAFGLYVRTLLPTFFSLIKYGALSSAEGKEYPRQAQGSKWPFKSRPDSPPGEG